MIKNKEAMHWQNRDDSIECMLCPHKCHLNNNQTGICRARRNIDSKLYSLNYGQISSICVDPIEKKPLFHFYPSSQILSVGTFGCNLRCPFCQNWQIAHDNPNTHNITPNELVAKAIELNSIGIAFTYNEPSIWYEFVYDTCIISKKSGLKNVLVTNGFISEKPLREILPYIDAMNIDIKGFTNEYYNDILKGSLEDVKRNVEIASENCHIEITTLIVPGLNDNTDEIGRLSRWLSSINNKIPLHLTRYFPNYKMELPPTSKDRLYQLSNEAKKYLKNVYLGNMH